MTQRSDIKLGLFDVVPNPDHVHKPDVVKNKNGRRVERQSCKIFDKQSFLYTILGRVNKNERRLGKQWRMTCKNSFIREVTNDLNQLAIFEVSLSKNAFGK